ncbi:hypothetical protein ACTSKR_12215 [Chitinibacteraceae bacterium HSL-7]
MQSNSPLAAKWNLMRDVAAQPGHKQQDANDELWRWMQDVIHENMTRIHELPPMLPEEGSKPLH